MPSFLAPKLYLQCEQVQHKTRRTSTISTLHNDLLLLRELLLRLFRGKNYDHQPSLSALKQSMDNGCIFCRYLWGCFAEAGCDMDLAILESDENTRVWIQSYDKENINAGLWDLFGNELPISVFCGPEDSIITDNRGILNFGTEDDNPAALYVKGRVVDPDPSSDSTYAKIDSWIRECIESHTACQSPTPAPMPTRLIDVGPPDGSREPFLHETKGESGKYITLSYCWGPSQPVVTTKENLDAHKHTIAFATLPQTIQDAITITRKLGVQYLWVDALCIIQDPLGGEDWQIESSKMGDIYGDALLTIAAESGSTCHSGILTRRREGKRPCRIPYFRQDGEECGSVVIYPPLDPVMDDDNEETVENTLSTRGWAFQEKKLSKRVLSYEESKVDYACKTATADESVPFATSRFIDLIGGSSTRNLPSTFSTQSPKRNFDLWYESITKYSARQLTYPSDKLPAISGYAHEMYKVVGGSYLAGLWGDDIVVGLLWSASVWDAGPSEDTQPPRSQPAIRDPNEQTEELTKSSKRRPPSWSWASLDCPVRYSVTLNATASLRDDSLRVCNILAGHVIHSTLDPMGQVSSGLLKIEGHLKEAWWLRRPEGLTPWMPQDVYDPNNPPQQPELDGPLLNFIARSLDPEVDSWDILLDVEEGVELSSALIPTSPDGRPFAVCNFDVRSDCPQRVWCLPLLVDRGLLLHRSSEGEEITYRRVGLFKVLSPNWFLSCPLTAVTIV